MEFDRGTLKKTIPLCYTLENDRGLSKFERTYCEQQILTELHVCVCVCVKTFSLVFHSFQKVYPPV